MTKSFGVELVNGKRSDQLLAAACAPLKPEQRKLAEGITLTLHSRHVGIPPELAVGLARVFTEATLQPAAYPAPWQEVGHRLQETVRDLVMGGSRDGERRMQTGIALRWNAAMSYIILRLAAPLVSAGCGEVGKMYLFCADENEGIAVGEGDYQAHVAALTAAIEQLCKARGSAAEAEVQQGRDVVEYDLFWQERAMMLAGMTQDRPSVTALSGGGAEHRALPAASAPALAMFVNLRPEMPHREQESPRLIELAKRRHLYDRRARDAGASGVYVTRSPEEMHRMLLSELQHPRLARYDRLFNSGYFAIERPPKPVQVRDIAIAGILPGTASEEPVTGFVKTCWFEFLMRFSQLLQRSGLNKSELRWIEGDTLWRMHPKSLLTGTAPRLPASFDQRRLQAYRNFFLMKMGWLPGYLDERAYYETLRLDERADSTQSPEVAEWVRAAWSVQRESARWAQQERAGRNSARQPERGRGDGFLQSKWALEKFAFVHVMLFLPAPLQSGGAVGRQMDEEKAREIWAAYQAMLGRRHRSLTVSITWLPSSMGHGDAGQHAGPAWGGKAWGVSSKRLRGSLLFEEDTGIVAMAGRLIETWESMLTEELHRA